MTTAIPFLSPSPYSLRMVCLPGQPHSCMRTRLMTPDKSLARGG